MKFEWDSKKSNYLKEKRGISFEEIIELINSKNLLTVRNHPNPEKYPGQKIFIINIEGYVWVVPFERRGDKLRLVTAYPSRKLSKIYLRGKDEHKED